MKKDISRRSFMKGAAIGGAALAVSGSGIPSAFALSTPAPEKFDQEADLIIVGGGAAAATAALTAAENGLSVIMIEKMPFTGGNSTICGGATAWAGTDMQKEAGVEDSTDLFIKDMMATGGGVNDKALVTAYVNNALPTYYWLKEQGVIFNSLGIGSGMTVKRAHFTTPSLVMKTLMDKAKANGANIILNAPAERLLYSNGRIVGVSAKVRNRPTTFGGKKGVLLACGGFSWNKEIFAMTVPTMANATTLASKGNVGDGLKMAWAYGAGIADTPYIKATFGFPQKVSTMSEMATVFFHGAIIVNKEGKRYCDESLDYKLLGDASLVQKDGIGIQIYDSAIRETGNKSQYGRTEDVEKKGFVKKADTLEGLAKALNIDPATLVATVGAYNENIDKTGMDPVFGRTALASGYGEGQLVKIDKPPYYAMESVAVLLGTYCGITVTPKLQVTDIFKQVIPGLYAAGEVIGGMHGMSIMSGTGFGKSLVLGRMAVKEIVAAK